MEYFRINLYRQGEQKIQKGVFGLRSEVVVVLPSLFVLLCFFVFLVRFYVPKLTMLHTKQQEIQVYEAKLDSLVKATRLIAPSEIEFLKLRKERVRLTPCLQDLARSLPRNVWLTDLEWIPAPRSTRSKPGNKSFSFRENEFVIKGRAIASPGQVPLRLVNEFRNNLSNTTYFGRYYDVELGRTFETMERKPRTSFQVSSSRKPSQPLAAEYRSVMEFVIRCKPKKDNTSG